MNKIKRLKIYNHGDNDIMSKGPKKYTEYAGAKIDAYTAHVMRNSKYSYRDAIQYFVSKINDPVEELKIRKKVLTDKIEKIMIRQINPLKEELGDVEYKLKQLNVDVSIDDTVLAVAHIVKNSYKNKGAIFPDLLSYIKSDKNLVIHINRCDMPFDEFIGVVERLMEEED